MLKVEQLLSTENGWVGNQMLFLHEEGCQGDGSTCVCGVL